MVNQVNLDHPRLDRQLLDPELTIARFMDLLQSAQLDGPLASYPMLFPLTWNRWPIWVRALGGELFSEDGRICLLDSGSHPKITPWVAAS